MNILAICMEGRNRSRYLGSYLTGLGHTTSYGGVKIEAENPITQSQIDLADVVIAVRRFIKRRFLGRFSFSGRIITLDIVDDPFKFPERFPPEALDLARSSYADFQEKYVYPEIRRQINYHLPFLELQK